MQFIEIISQFSLCCIIGVMAKKPGRRGHKKQSPAGKVIQNRRASHDYKLEDSLTVGMELTGRETKSLRLGHGQLRGAYVTVKGGELFLIGCTIHGASGIAMSEQEQTRTRKLLARRREIDALIAAKTSGMTIVPLEILTRGRYIKLRISLGRGQKLWDKRHVLKQREDQRNTARAISNGVLQ